jgi:hypothetical protein
VSISRDSKENLLQHVDMSEASFNELVDLLAPHSQVDRLESRSCYAGIKPLCKRIMVAAGLRWLGVEQYKSLTDIFPFSRLSSRSVVEVFNAKSFSWFHLPCEGNGKREKEICHV